MAGQSSWPSPLRSPVSQQRKLRPKLQYVAGNRRQAASSPEPSVDESHAERINGLHQSLQQHLELTEGVVAADRGQQAGFLCRNASALY